MTKGEFLETLEQKLTGEIDAERVRKNLQYYDRYIEDAIRSGRTEQSVLEELGSPLLIAKTIIDTNDVRAEGANARWDQRSYQGTDEESSRERNHTFHMEMDDKKAKVMIILAVIVILVLVFTVLRILLPILLPVVLVLLVINLLKKR